jgi:N-acylneuraminate cytidylyltransferase/CMP-N,N'-diacetyllegionaminic acid synthase
VTDALLFLLERLKREEDYEPEYLLLLQATSPLRELEDIRICAERIRSEPASTVLTTCPVQPRRDDLVFVNRKDCVRGGIAARGGSALCGASGGVYIMRVADFLREKKVIMNKTLAVLRPAWRSIDIDTIEDWTIAEVLFLHREEIKKQLPQPLCD